MSAIAAIVAKAGIDTRVVRGDGLEKPTNMAALAGAPMRSMRGIRMHTRTRLWCGLMVVTSYACSDACHVRQLIYMLCSALLMCNVLVGMEHVLTTHQVARIP